MKRYEGLFILNTAGKEEGIKDIIDHISADIAAAGGKIETVQKMDKRAFSRIADKKYTSGFYVNVIFEAPPAAISQLNHRFELNDDVFRVMFTDAAAVVAAEVAK
jgi:small subunit ribosomal protein S6